jgi:stage II sporulation protein M
MKKEKYEGFFGGIYKRNETFFMISGVILLISILIGFALGNILTPFMGSMFADMKSRAATGTLSIIVNNLKDAVLIYGGGLLFGTVTVFYLVVNGGFLGYLGTQYPLGDYVLFSIPHGIPELLGLAIAGAAGFRLSSCIYHILQGLTHMRSDISRENQFRYIIELNEDEFWESLKLLAIAFILLILAAIIEANLSVAWGNYVTSII